MKALTVFCGSGPGKEKIYSEVAAAMGKAMAERGIALVYGGGRLGLMGVIADTALAYGGEVYGVIPDRLVRAERAHRECTKLYVVESMQARKNIMAQLSDGFISMPGGLGTLDEMFEMLTWQQLGIMNKPSALLNVANYWDPLIRMIEVAVENEFIREDRYAKLIVETEINGLLDRMDQEIISLQHDGHGT
jgi:uncharacterized protein (TIGR00730 family)